MCDAFCGVYVCGVICVYMCELCVMCVCVCMPKQGAEMERRIGDYFNCFHE